MGLNLPLLLENRITSKISQAIIRLLSIDKLYCISFKQDDQVYGNVSIITRKKCKKVNTHLIESFISQVSIFIQKKFAEIKLKDSELQKELILNSTSEMINFYDTDLSIIWSNKAAAESLGKAEADIAGQHCYKMWCQTDKPCENCPVKKAHELKIPQQVEQQTPDGKIWALRAYPVKDDKDNVIGMVEFGREITEQKQAEITLKESEEKFRTIFENAPVMIDAFDANGKCILWNKECERVFGYTIEEVNEVDDPFSLFYPDAEIRAEVIKTVISEPDKKYREWNPVTKGEKKLTALWANFRISDKLVINIGHDITTRKQAEEKIRKINGLLQESELKYKTAFFTSPDSVNINKLDGEYVEVNQGFTRLTGYTEEDVIGKLSSKIDIWANPQDREKLRDGLLKDGLIENLEAVFKTKSGKLIPALMSARIMELNNEKHILSITKSITELKKAEEQIKQDLKEKNLLIQEIYHRTKNNMAVISAMLAMESERSENEQLASTFREINNKIQAMSMVHQKLYQAKDLTNINLDDYIKDLLNLIMQSYGKLSEKVTLKLDLQETKISIDYAIPLGLIINELVSNIFKHAFPENQEGDVVMRLFKEASGTINLELSDNGVGFPENFDPRKHGSMGLILVFAIAEKQLIGEVSVKSENGLKWQIKIHDDHNYIV